MSITTHPLLKNIIHRGVFLWIVFWLLAGWIASMIMDTNSRQGLVVNIVMGILGAVLGGWLMGFFGGTGITGFNVYSLGVAIVGALVLILAVQAVPQI